LSALMMEIEAKIQSQGTISNDDLHNIVERANTTMRFMSTTINDFWNFFSKDKEATRFYPKDVIETTLSILNATLKKSSVTVNVKAYHECEVFGFKNEFSQAVINIISNAKDIMVERDIEKPTLTITLEQIEDYYEIIFEDNGGGIQVELLDRIFDPFVSERLISSSGIGLCMTKNIIEDSMKGKILVSNGTKGAKFVMRLPLASSQDELVSQT
ncbi:MAG: HAMP domain-containing histidine kinase, partial [Thiovulaceae bacterium]|nr:HAMP domain-containing histidine kinase [Sulfurimonadaceae bacterium]